MPPAKADKGTHRSPALMDRPERYGWVSIGLHWLAAVTVIAMWFVGQSIDASENGLALRNLHVSLGLAAWLFLALRIGWRLRSGHPHVRGLGPAIFRFARATHYVMLLLVGIMLVSGPLLVWASGVPVELYGGVSLFAQGSSSPALQYLASTIHGVTATSLVVLTALHIAGAFKHLMFHDDETFVSMLRPGGDGHQP
jgi:cytochrome b561